MKQKKINKQDIEVFREISNPLGMIDGVTFCYSDLRPGMAGQIFFNIEISKDLFQKLWNFIEASQEEPSAYSEFYNGKSNIYLNIQIIKLGSIFKNFFHIKWAFMGGDNVPPSKQVEFAVTCVDSIYSIEDVLRGFLQCNFKPKQDTSENVIESFLEEGFIPFQTPARGRG